MIAARSGPVVTVRRSMLAARNEFARAIRGGSASHRVYGRGAMLIDARDPRHDLSAWPCAEQPASASEPLFAPHACGSCGLAECNATTEHGVWVRRAGPYVLLMPPHAAAFAVDALAYAHTFCGDIDELPAISASDRARYGGWVALPEDPSRWVDDAGGVLAASRTTTMTSRRS